MPFKKSKLHLPHLDGCYYKFKKSEIASIEVLLA